MKAYRITDWGERYEIAQSRKCKKMNWVAMPNSHTGNGYSVVAQHERAEELFTAFILLVEVASIMPERGLLVSDGGKPITAKNLAFRTHFPAEIFSLAFRELTKEDIGWLEVVEDWERTGRAVGHT